MSQTQMAETVAKPKINARRFLSSKGINFLLGKGYTLDSVDSESRLFPNLALVAKDIFAMSR